MIDQGSKLRRATRPAGMKLRASTRLGAMPLTSMRIAHEPAEMG
jgi:hypothetical protein